MSVCPEDLENSVSKLIPDHSALVEIIEKEILVL